MAEQIVDLTSGLYRFMLDAEPLVVSGGQRFQAAKQRLARVAQNLGERASAAKGQAAAKFDATLDAARGRLQRIAAELQKSREPDDSDDSSEGRERLRELYRKLGDDYEALRAQIRKRRIRVPQDVTLGALKPRNLSRNVFHVMNALIGVLMYEFVLDKSGVLWVTGVMLAMVTVIEISRRISARVNERFVNGLFSKISRPGEAHEVPAATWYLLALFIGCAILPQRAIQLGTLALGLGDPVASLVGKRWGRFKLVGQKSLAGTLGFAAAAAVSSVIFLSLAAPTLGVGAIALISGGVAIAGALAELFTGRVDDNFTIPLVAGTAAWALLAALII